MDLAQRLPRPPQDRGWLQAAAHLKGHRQHGLATRMTRAKSSSVSWEVVNKSLAVLCRANAHVVGGLQQAWWSEAVEGKVAGKDLFCRRHKWIEFAAERRFEASANSDSEPSSISSQEVGVTAPAQARPLERIPHGGVAYDLSVARVVGRGGEGEGRGDEGRVSTYCHKRSHRMQDG